MSSIKNRRKQANLLKGQELLALKYSQLDQATLLKTKNERRAKARKEKEQAIKLKQVSYRKQTHHKTKSKKSKTGVKVLITVIILIVLAGLGLFGYKYAYDNYLHKGNFIFQTNLDNVTAEFISTDNKQEKLQEKIKESVIYTSLDYDQINIKNDKIEENIVSNDSFFKYYGEDYAILTLNSKYTIDYLFYTPFDETTLSFESDNNCISIKDNIITANEDGEATIYACYGNNKTKLLSITSTSLILDRPKEFDDTKEFLTCEQYTDEENAILDKILEYRINQAGYKTRAGAVEALRFLTLELPYRVSYFYENGRLPYLDAQGRYYHKGLYLSAGKYKELNDPDHYNKGTWGCKIFSGPAEEKMPNGLDCSGLMGWALYNAGFDPDDVKGSDLLMDLGETYSSKKIIDSGRVKVGDFVHNDEASSHIGMIIGIDDEENYYVAQAIWYKPKGVIISKYTKKQFVKHWIQICILEDYYKEDGNLTNMWY